MKFADLAHVKTSDAAGDASPKTPNFDDFAYSSEDRSPASAPRALSRLQKTKTRMGKAPEAPERSASPVVPRRGPRAGNMSGWMERPGGALKPGRPSKVVQQEMAIVELTQRRQKAERVGPVVQAERKRKAQRMDQLQRRRLAKSGAGLRVGLAQNVTGVAEYTAKAPESSEDELEILGEPPASKSRGRLRKGSGGRLRKGNRRTGEGDSSSDSDDVLYSPTGRPVAPDSLATAAKPRSERLEGGGGAKSKKSKTHQKNMKNPSASGTWRSRPSADEAAPKGKKAKREATEYLEVSNDSADDEDDALGSGNSDAEVVVLSDDDRGVSHVVTDLVSRCKRLTNKLSSTIAAWDGGAPATGSETPDSSGLDPGDAATDRVNLTALAGGDAAGADRILTSQDIAELCGGNLKLKDYQEVGVNWLRLLHANSVNGVLADEMGLGKTVQTIAFFAWLGVDGSGWGEGGSAAEFASKFTTHKDPDARNNDDSDEDEEDLDDDDNDDDDNDDDDAADAGDVDDASRGAEDAGGDIGAEAPAGHAEREGTDGEERAGSEGDARPPSDGATRALAMDVADSDDDAHPVPAAPVSPAGSGGASGTSDVEDVTPGASPSPAPGDVSTSPMDDLDHCREGVRNPRPHLVVVPSSVLTNWCTELRKFAPQLRVMRFHGTQNERMELRRRLGRHLTPRDAAKRRALVARFGAGKGGVDVVLATPGLWERDTNDLERNFFRRHRWGYLVVDEAHALKNATSARYRRLRDLRASACANALLLSGTPVQNRPEELLNLLGFLQPTIFTAVEMEACTEALAEEAAAARRDGKALVDASPTLDKLRDVLRPFVLRRLKAEVLRQLMPKTDRAEIVDMTPAQRRVYEGILQRFAEDKMRGRKRTGKRGTLGARKKQKTEASAGTGGPASQRQITEFCGNSSGAAISGAAVSKAPEGDPALAELLEEAASLGGPKVKEREARNIFTELRKAANHPLLLRTRFRDDAVLASLAGVCVSRGHFGTTAGVRKVRAELETLSDFDLHQICCEYGGKLAAHTLPEAALFDSPKFARLAKLLPELVDQDHRILLFSQWTRILDLLEVLLETLGMAFVRLDGSLPVPERQALIDRYNRAPGRELPVFLLSTRAGGQGINLTAADTVILHDVDFNPEIDRQAEDRCHRIGQTRPVTIYRLVCRHTVDEQIYEMGLRKGRVTKRILKDTEAGAADEQPEAGTVRARRGKGLNMSGMLTEALGNYVKNLGSHQDEAPLLSGESTVTTLASA